MSLQRHTAANLIGAIVPMAVSLATVPIYLGLIGAERYGVLAVLWVILGYFGFLDLGLGRAVAQRMAKLSAPGDTAERTRLLWTALQFTLVIGLIGGILLWHLAELYLARFVKVSSSTASEAYQSVVWMTLALPVLLLTSVLQGTLQGRFRFVELNIAQVAGNVVMQLLPLAFALNGYIELNYLIPIAICSRLFLLGNLLYQGKKHTPLQGTPVIDVAQLVVLLKYGGWMSVVSIMGPLLVVIDRLAISAVSGARFVTYYTIPYDLVTRAMVVPGSLASAIFPRLASSDDAPELATRATAVILQVMTPIVVIGLFFARPFLELWVGDEIADQGGRVAEIILIGVWLYALMVPHHMRLLAAGNPRVVVAIYVFQLPVYLVMLWVGLTEWGIIGAAAAWALRVLLDALLQLRTGGSLASTVRIAWIHAVLIVCSLMSVFMLEQSSLTRWATGGALLGLALILAREQIVAGTLILRRIVKK